VISFFAKGTWSFVINGKNLVHQKEFNVINVLIISKKALYNTRELW
jgi:hypothetical protein